MTGLNHVLDWCRQSTNEFGTAQERVVSIEEVHSDGASSGKGCVSMQALFGLHKDPAPVLSPEILPGFVFQQPDTN